MPSQSPPDALIISHEFPPYHNVIGGMIRMLKLAEFLSNRGHRITIIAAGGQECGYFGYERLISDLDVHYIPRLLRKARNIQRIGDCEGKPPRGEGKARLWLKSIMRDLIVPDINVLSVFAFFREALQIIESSGARNIIISSPPHSMQLVGVLLKRKFGASLNVIADFRDSWNTRDIFCKRNPISSRINLACERAVLKSCDHLLYVSEPMIRKIGDRILDVSKKSTLVMNGFDPSMCPALATLPASRIGAGDHLRISHFGSINTYQRKYRNPEVLFRAILKTRLPIKVALYGHVDVDEHWRELMGDRLEVHGNLEHREAVAAMARQDLLLFLHTRKEDSDEIISGKLFDYMLARRPVLVVGPPAMEVSRIVRGLGLGYCLDVSDADAVEQGLTNIVDAWRRGKFPDLATQDISIYSRDRQYEKVVELLR
jgi:glycosyltransferase involved in cell wall biosynthesis